MRIKTTGEMIVVGVIVALLYYVQGYSVGEALSDYVQVIFNYAPIIIVLGLVIVVVKKVISLLFGYGR